MSRKHYIAVAEVIAEQGKRFPQSLIAIENIAHLLANLFAEDNPRFSYNRFMVACGFIGGDK